MAFAETVGQSFALRDHTDRLKDLACSSIIELESHVLLPFFCLHRGHRDRLPAAQAPQDVGPAELADDFRRPH